MSSPISDTEHRRPSYASVVAATMDQRHAEPMSGIRDMMTDAAGARDEIEERIAAQLMREAHGHQDTISVDESQLNQLVKMPSPVELQPFNTGLSYSGQSDHSPFLVPSYLRRSRYIQRLRDERDAHMAAMRERRRSYQPPSKGPALSNSSSSTNLNGASQHSSVMHRGVAQHVVERVPHTAYAERSGRLRPLPSKWNEDDKVAGLETLADGCEVRLSGILKSVDEAASARADEPIPKEIGLYYFEVSILSRNKEGLIGVGFAGRKTPLTRLPGWEPDSYAYHGDDGMAYASSATGKRFGPRFASQDVIGCGINFRTSTIFFTKNGVFIGSAFTDAKTDLLWPAIGLKKQGEHIRANFGQQPFCYDIDSVVEKERAIAFTSLNTEPVTLLHPPDTADTLIQSLVAQYLAHEGYVATSKAFAQDLDEQKKAAPSESRALPNAWSEHDDAHASQRQQIRRAILDGDIDSALRYTNDYYPTVLGKWENHQIYFKLKCRKFIEMIRRYSDLQLASPQSDPSKSIESIGGNGHSYDSLNGNAHSTQMEIDDQLQREASKASGVQIVDDIDMEISGEMPRKLSTMKFNELQISTIAYGQELEEEFGRDDNEIVRKQLDDIFSLLAYPDPQSSMIGHLLDKDGRTSVAEELNGAILVSLGKPSSAALEKLCMQTESFLDAVASKTGGAAAFVNIRQDILQA